MSLYALPKGVGPVKITRADHERADDAVASYSLPSFTTREARRAEVLDPFLIGFRRDVSGRLAEASARERALVARIHELEQSLVEVGAAIDAARRLL